MAQKITSKFLRKLLKQENSHQLDSRLTDIEHILFDYYRTFVKNHKDFICVVSTDGKIVTENKNIFAHLGYSKKKSIQYEDLMSKEQFKLLKELFEKAKKGIMSEERILLFCQDGSIEYFDVSFSAIKSTDNHLAGIYVVAQNKTNEEQLKNELTNSNKFYETIFDNLEVGIWAQNYKNNKITFASKGLEKMIKVSSKDIYNGTFTWNEMIPLSFHQLLAQNAKLIQKGRRITQTYQMKLANDKYIWLYEQIIPQKNDLGEVVNLFGLVMDVTERVNLRTQIQYMLHHDQVTTLSNQQKLFNDLDKLMKDKQNYFALFCLSLDNFDWYNNSLGYLIGEQILKLLSNKLVRSIPTKATLYKTAMNEFTCIINHYESKDHVFKCVKKMINIVKEELELKGYQINLQSSVGVSFFPEHGEEKYEIIRNANSALYHARQMGEQNYQLFSYDRDIYSLKKYMLQQDLMNALEKDEFELYFQPIVNSMTGEIVWSEALIRWKHDEWGVVSPQEFIGIAEEQHLIHEITDWTIQQVCMQLSSWMKQKRHVRPISINISPLRFLKNDIVEVIQNSLKKYRIAGEFIILEITENVAVNNEYLFKDMLKSIKQLGIKIALDDFGTGYASFQYLHQFDFDILKIDKSFIYGLENGHSKNQKIITSMIKLAKSLDLLVVGEGVEEEGQLRFLKENGCQLVQGYFYSPPVSSEEFTTLLSSAKLKPKNLHKGKIEDSERREYFRFHFPGSLVAQMNVIELNKKKVNVGSTIILINNISLGGIKFFSFLKLPVNLDMILKFKFKIMDNEFLLKGIIVRCIEERAELFSYGVSFKNVSEVEKDKLAEVINRMTALHKMKEEIPETEITKLSPIKYLTKQTR